VVDINQMGQDDGDQEQNDDNDADNGQDLFHVRLHEDTSSRVKGQFSGDMILP
jgi:hypothetical protein